MKRFNLALRLLWRDSRSGELGLLITALIIAVTSASAVALFADRLQQTMMTQSAEFLAGDLAVSSSASIPNAWLAKAVEWQLKQARTTEFSSVLMEHDEILLASVKAVTEAYPLRGQLKTTESDYANETQSAQGPPAGTVWVEKRILSALKLNLGDRLTVGEKALQVTRILTYEPDKQGDFFSFSPRVMMNDADLAATQVIQPGSHVHYFAQFTGTEQALQAYSQWLKPQLNPSQRLLDIRQDRPEIGLGIERAERYLSLSSIVVILLAGVAIAMAARRYSERHFNATALLRCLGCQQQEILFLYGSQFIVLGLLASVVGCGLGWLAQAGLFHLLKPLLPQHVANPSPVALLFGAVIGMAVLLGFALPPLLRLKQVSPLRVLRRELEPLPSSAWLVYGLAISIVGILVWQATHDLKMTSTILGVGLVCWLLLGALVYALLGLIQPLLPKLSLSWRFGLQGLSRNRTASVSQILAFSITLVAMLLSYNVRNDLLDNWQKQLPENAPNHFALNIFPDQQAAFQQALQAGNIRSSRFYPVSRGRLVAINAIPVQKVVSKDSQGEGATHRELSLTWSQTLPEENSLSQGIWWTSPQAGQVSVEQKLAESLKIKLGDKLTFTLGSEQLEATVTSIRALQWGTMKPNFYMIFSPGTLDAFPSTYLTSFYLPAADKNQLNGLVKQFPAVTLLEVDALLQQFKTLLSQLTQAINYLLYFALMAGFTVLFAALLSTLDQRIYEGALMRTLGANRRLLQNAHLIEYGVLGLLAGGLSVILSETLLYVLYTRVLSLDYHPVYALWAIVPFGAAVLVGIAGLLGLRGVLSKPPLQVLREL
ncbi:ABC transporter permease [Methylosoma difficile]